MRLYKQRNAHSGRLPEAHGTERHAFYPVRHRERVDPDRVFCCRCRAAIPLSPPSALSPVHGDQKQSAISEITVFEQTGRQVGQTQTEEVGVSC